MNTLHKSTLTSLTMLLASLSAGYAQTTNPASSAAPAATNVTAAATPTPSATTPTVMPTPPPAADPNHPVSSVPGETKAQRDARMAWWRDAKFGMFVHWGVYSVPAGFYNGKPVAGIGEWIMNRGKIPMAEYQKFAGQFTADKFDAAQFVATAKNAGMKYIVITAKHHDGFAMFNSKANKWTIVRATPFKKDPLKALAKECRKQGIKLGFYYSQAQDWNNGGSAAGGKWDKAQEHSMDDYIEKTAVPQVTELLSKYGADTPAVIWWDTPTDMNADRASKIDAVVQKLRPGLIQNNRLGGGYKGDTETPEQHIPAQGYPGRDWETCMTLNGTWGFKKDDQNWKSLQTIIQNLSDIASKGGNYLLNVGPDSHGEIPPASVKRLAEVGEWMKVNGAAIYGSGPTPFGAEAGSFSATEKDKKGQPLFKPEWNWRATTKPGHIYLIVFKWPADGTFQVPVVKEKLTGASLLADPSAKLTVAQDDKGVTISGLPAKAPDATASVIDLKY
jgi:alpha-L-fucosidase